MGNCQIKHASCHFDINWWPVSIIFKHLESKKKIKQFFGHTFSLKNINRVTF